MRAAEKPSTITKLLGPRWHSWTRLRCWMAGRLRGLVGSALDHRSLPSEFESRRGHSWRVFHLWLRFITLGRRSAHLGCHVHKSGRKTPIIIIMIITTTLKNKSSTVFSPFVCFCIYFSISCQYCVHSIMMTVKASSVSLLFCFCSFIVGRVPLLGIETSCRTHKKLGTQAQVSAIYDVLWNISQ